jgi:hypothetical protein
MMHISRDDLSSRSGGTGTPAQAAASGSNVVGSAHPQNEEGSRPLLLLPSSSSLSITETLWLAYLKEILLQHQVKEVTPTTLVGKVVDTLDHWGGKYIKKYSADLGQLLLLTVVSVRGSVVNYKSNDASWPLLAGGGSSLLVLFSELSAVRAREQKARAEYNKLLNKCIEEMKWQHPAEKKLFAAQMKNYCDRLYHTTVEDAFSDEKKAKAVFIVALGGLVALEVLNLFKQDEELILNPHKVILGCVVAGLFVKLVNSAMNYSEYWTKQQEVGLEKMLSYMDGLRGWQQIKFHGDIVRQLTPEGKEKYKALLTEAGISPSRFKEKVESERGEIASMFAARNKGRALEKLVFDGKIRSKVIELWEKEPKMFQEILNSRAPFTRQEVKISIKEAHSTPVDVKEKEIEEGLWEWSKIIEGDSTIYLDFS